MLLSNNKHSIILQYIKASTMKSHHSLTNILQIQRNIVKKTQISNQKFKRYIYRFLLEKILDIGRPICSTLRLYILMSCQPQNGNFFSLISKHERPLNTSVLTGNRFDQLVTSNIHM